LSEVRFGDVAVLKQFLVLRHKNSWKFVVHILDLRFLVHMPEVISKLSLVEHFLIWSTENPLKIRPLSAVLFWQISATIHFLPLYRFLFEIFWSRNFWGSCYSSLYFICGGFRLKPEAKNDWLYVMLTLMLLTDLCLVLYEGSFQV
jgi:hypothetical protein